MSRANPLKALSTIQLSQYRPLAKPLMDRTPGVP